MMPDNEPPGYRNMPELPTYSVKCKCMNCGWHQTIEVKRGEKIRDHICDIECDYCGCKELKPSK